MMQLLFFGTMVQLEFHYKLLYQVGSQQFAHMTTNEQPILKRLIKQKGAAIMLMHYACVANFDELATLVKTL
jgi:hypothetical protein